MQGVDACCRNGSLSKQRLKACEFLVDDADRTAFAILLSRQTFGLLLELAYALAQLRRPSAKRCAAVIEQSLLGAHEGGSLSGIGAADDRRKGDGIMAVALCCKPGGSRRKLSLAVAI